jgi:probable phosphoglycerate mutase
MPELRECDVGALEGRGDAVAFGRYHEVWDRWLAGQELERPLGEMGETGESALGRMRKAIEFIRSEHSNGTVVLVSHMGLLHFTLNLLLRNVLPAWTAERPIPNTGVIVASYGPEGLLCETWCGAAPRTTR